MNRAVFDAATQEIENLFIYYKTAEIKRTPRSWRDLRLRGVFYILDRIRRFGIFRRLILQQV